MKIEIDIGIIEGNKIAHEVIKYLSSYALEILIEHAAKELKARVEFEGR